MNSLKNIKAIIFDYGSALEVHGRNWLHPIHQAYADMGVDVSKEILLSGMSQCANSHASHDSSNYYYSLEDFFTSRALGQIQWLIENHPHLLKDVSTETLSRAVARSCYDHARTNALILGNILHQLAKRFRLALVSKFNGNLNAILEDFSVRQHFAILSTDPEGAEAKTIRELLELTIRSLGLLPRDILIVGDSIKRDIIPAVSLGCNTAWLQSIILPNQGTASSDGIVLPKSTLRLKNIAELQDRLCR